MAYTQSDLEKVERAIIDLAAGERVVEVQFGSGESTRYDGSVGLMQLVNLRDRIRGEIAASQNGKRMRGYRLNHRRGL
ncbi:hypothetical protein H3221_013420 [Pseudomonas sp. LMG 31766]|uniref:Uncharacterized protein n=1 Tax=Pseudomonas chaetocerotis TaxID=2758695 RepID=A0A931CXX3_9PSED|nr:hypothetical protein [Pseudomonas chaetocerotis]MBZ9665751.1 hypothetical protein [Pseudomonas chaetocerotis]